jgi:hypothetical protein
MVPYSNDERGSSVAPSLRRRSQRPWRKCIHLILTCLYDYILVNICIAVCINQLDTNTNHLSFRKWCKQSFLFNRGLCNREQKELWGGGGGMEQERTIKKILFYKPKLRLWDCTANFAPPKQTPLYPQYQSSPWLGFWFNNVLNNFSQIQKEIF